MRLNYWLLMVVAVVLVAGCSSEKSKKGAWEKAKLENTIQAYQDFLKRYPQSVFSDSARLVIKNLYNERHPAFRHTRTVKIIVEESYGDAEGVSLPFYRAAKRIFEYTGLTVVGSNVSDYDFTVTIKAKGTPIDALYKSGPDRQGRYEYRRFYSIASIEGTISVEIPNFPVYEKHFSGRAGPISSSNLQESPSSAPFNWAFNESNFVRELVVIMRDFFGFSSVIAALGDAHWDIRRHAAESFEDIKDPPIERLIAALKKGGTSASLALANIGKPAVEPLLVAMRDQDLNVNVRRRAIYALGNIKDARAVEPLIAALKDEDKGVRENTAEALGDIKDARAIEPLIAAMKDTLKDEGSPVKWKAEQALKKITGKNFWYDTVKWQEWWEQNKRDFNK